MSKSKESMLNILKAVISKATPDVTSDTCKVSFTLSYSEMSKIWGSNNLNIVTRKDILDFNTDWISATSNLNKSNEKELYSLALDRCRGTLSDGAIGFSRYDFVCTSSICFTDLGKTSFSLLFILKGEYSKILSKEVYGLAIDNTEDEAFFKNYDYMELVLNCANIKAREVDCETGYNGKVYEEDVTITINQGNFKDKFPRATQLDFEGLAEAFSTAYYEDNFLQDYIKEYLEINSDKEYLSVCENFTAKRKDDILTLNFTTFSKVEGWH